MSDLSLTYIGYGLAKLADERLGAVTRERYDVQACPGEDHLLEREIYLMLWSMYVEGEETLIPYLVEQGIDCGKLPCTQTEQIVAAGTGMLNYRPGQLRPIIVADASGLPDGGAPTVGNGTGNAGGGDTHITIINNNYGGMQHVITFEVGKDGAPMADEGTEYQNDLFKGYKVLVFSNGSLISTNVDPVRRYIIVDSNTGLVTFPQGVVALEELSFYRYL
jgi:hypothetical protein